MCRGGGEGGGGIYHYESDGVVEVLTTLADCPLFWVPYTGGNPLPVPYIAKIEDNGRLCFGYYNTETEVMYYVYDAKYSNAMEILILIWHKSDSCVYLSSIWLAQYHRPVSF